MGARIRVLNRVQCANLGIGVALSCPSHVPTHLAYSRVVSVDTSLSRRRHGMNMGHPRLDALSTVIYGSNTSSQRLGQHVGEARPSCGAVRYTPMYPGCIAKDKRIGIPAAENATGVQADRCIVDRYLLAPRLVRRLSRTGLPSRALPIRHVGDAVARSPKDARSTIPKSIAAPIPIAIGLPVAAPMHVSHMPLGSVYVSGLFPTYA